MIDRVMADRAVQRCKVLCRNPRFLQQLAPCSFFRHFTFERASARRGFIEAGGIGLCKCPLHQEKSAVGMP